MATAEAARPINKCVFDQLNEEFGSPVLMPGMVDVDLIDEPLMNPANYHGNFNLISHSMIQQFLASRTKYARIYVSQEDPPRASTKAMETGEIIHEFVLRRKELKKFCCKYPREFESPTDTYQRKTTRGGKDYAKGDPKILDLYQQDGKLNGQNAKKFRAMMAEKRPEFEYFLTDAQWSDATDALDTLIRNKDLWSWIDHEDTLREEIITWTDNEHGVNCRAQIDFHIEFADCVLAHDLKVTEYVSPGQFVRQWWDNGKKWLQPQHYCRGLVAKYNKPVFWGYIAVKPTSSPTGHFSVARHSAGMLDPTSFADIYGASAGYDNLLQTIMNCYHANDWREPYAKGETVLDNPVVNVLQANPWTFDLGL